MAVVGEKQMAVDTRGCVCPFSATRGSRAGPRLVTASINRQHRIHGHSREARGAECLQLPPIRLAPDGSRQTLSILDRRIGSRAACAFSAQTAYRNPVVDKLRREMNAGLRRVVAERMWP